MVKQWFTLILLLFLLACTQKQPETPENPQNIIPSQPLPEQNREQQEKIPQSSALVMIRDSLAFDPEEVYLTSGNSVTWQVSSNVEEKIRIEEAENLFFSDTLSANDLFTYQFQNPGVYEIALANKGSAMRVYVE
ncbi:hypothetical protein J4410_02790 [Candidatus Woesearchaeota archaeon]|nr:hypothetical protein [Candidatus Woesearchaeota archaeon]